MRITRFELGKAKRKTTWVITGTIEGNFLAVVIAVSKPELTDRPTDRHRHSFSLQFRQTRLANVSYVKVFCQSLLTSVGKFLEISKGEKIMNSVDC